MVCLGCGGFLLHWKLLYRRVRVSRVTLQHQRITDVGVIPVSLTPVMPTLQYISRPDSQREHVSDKVDELAACVLFIDHRDRARRFGTCRTSSPLLHPRGLLWSTPVEQLCTLPNVGIRVHSRRDWSVFMSVSSQFSCNGRWMANSVQDSLTRSAVLTVCSLRRDGGSTTMVVHHSGGRVCT